MKLIINIELDAGVPGTTAQEKFDRTIAWVRGFFGVATGQIKPASFVNESGEWVNSHTAVITIFSGLNREAARQAIYNISFDLAQDCIATLFDDVDGELIGPAAESWGDFNPDFFVLPEPVSTGSRVDASIHSALEAA